MPDIADDTSARETAAVSAERQADGIMMAAWAADRVGQRFDGTVTSVFDTKHAIGMKAADGTEFLIHFGVDTVKLGGQGFEVFVEQGQQVKKGDKLMQVDLDYVKANAPSDVCLVIFTGGQAVHMPYAEGVYDPEGHPAQDVCKDICRHVPRR